MKKFIEQVTNNSNLPVNGATVTVRVANASPGTGALATIYSDDGITSIAGSVVTTDSTGIFSFYAPDGRYDLTAASAGVSRVYADIEIFDSTEKNTGDATASFNQVLVGDGTPAAPALSFASTTNSGWFHAGGGIWSFSKAGVSSILLSSGGVQVLPSSGAIEWTLGTTSNAVDTQVNRNAAGVVGIGTGTNSTSGSLALGGTPVASTGTIRMPQGATIMVRNTGNTADQSLIQSTGANTVQIGANQEITTSGTVIISASSASRIALCQNPAFNVLGLRSDGALGFSSTTSPSGAADAMVSRSGVNTIQIGVTGTTADSSGELDARTLGITGSTSGKTSLITDATASGSPTLKAGTYNIVGDSLTQTLTNKTLISPTSTGTDNGTETLTNKTLSGTTPFNRVRANQGTALVTGDVGSLSGWGTGATVSAVSGTDAAMKISITAGTSGFGANPAFTVTFHDGTWTAAPICQVTRGDVNSAGHAAATSTATTVSVTTNTTPSVASQVFVFYITCTGI